jgi:hypothetical protein
MDHVEMRIEIYECISIGQMAFFKKRLYKVNQHIDIKVVGDERLERSTSGSGDQRSIHLS